VHAWGGFHNFAMIVYESRRNRNLLRWRGLLQQQMPRQRG
jgi:hypothetical protein